MAEGVNIRIPEQVRDKLKELAKKNGISMGAMIRVMIERQEAMEEVANLKVGK